MQKGRMFICTILAIAVILALVVLPARADIYMKQKVHTGSFTIMGQTQPEKDEIVVYWMAKDRARTDNGDKTSSIFLLDKGILYQLDHQKKTCREMPLNVNLAIDEAVADKGKEAQEFAELAKEMAEAFTEGMEIKVTETGEKKKIGSWNCRKYIIESKMAFGDTKSEAWATEDLKMDPKLYLTVSNAMMAGNPGFSQMMDKIFKEMSRVKGVIVYQLNKTKAMDTEMTSTMELLEFDDKTPPPGLYEVPAGYKVIKGAKNKR